MEACRTTECGSPRRLLRRNKVSAALLFLLFLPLLAAPVLVRSAEPDRGLGAGRLEHVFPGAERIGAETEPPAAAPVYKGKDLVGYVFSSRKVVGSTGYSGKPLDILIGLDLKGRIAGTVLVEHQEPILVIGIPQERLAAFVRRFGGVDIRAVVRIGRRRTKGDVAIDGLSGATVSSVVIRDAIVRSARIVARAKGILPGGAGARLDLDTYKKLDWDGLIDAGALSRMRLTNRMVDARFPGPAPPGGATRDPSGTFIDLYMGLVTPALIGRNLLGDLEYNRLMAERRPGEQILFVAARGLYSFKGTSYVRTGTFDRVQIVQGAKTIRLTKQQHARPEKLRAENAPELREIGLFVLPAAAALDPVKPLRLELLVRRSRPDGSAAFARFALPYKIPGRLELRPAKTKGAAHAAAWDPRATVPLWQEIWQRRAPDIAVLVIALVALTAILFLQDTIVRRHRLYHSLRLGFLIFTVLWLGVYAGAQLSVVNVLTFSQALLTEFRWELFLLEPLIFILWGFVAVTMLFWGRGVFCGWLCPFGALQELLNRVARAVRIPQLTLPFGLHERLWPVKYVIFLGLFALSLGSMTLAVTGAEVEPFKTVVSLRFMRDWGFVLYAVALLAAGLFVGRFFCRYLCPLGGALAIPARLRMFEWLKRRPECGTVCQACAVSCPVQAIHPIGAINPNECIHCLKCQMIFYDDQTCPPLIERRKRRERRAGSSVRPTAGLSGDPDSHQAPQPNQPRPEEE